MLQDQELLLVYDEAVGPATQTTGNVGERSFKARVSVAWKEVFQAPLVGDKLRHLRPQLRVEPHYLDTSFGESKQFAAYGGGGRYEFSLSSAGSGGTITSSGLYVAGGSVGVDRILVSDQFEAEASALAEVQ